MKKEILFRGKDSRTNKWVYGWFVPIIGESDGFTEEFGIPKEVFSSGADGAAVFIEELTKSEWLKLKDKFDEQTGKYEE